MNLELLFQPIVSIVVLPLAGAALALLAGTFSRRLSGWISAVVAGATLLLALALFWQARIAPATFENPMPRWPVSPTPPTFYADVTSTSLIVLVAGVALCILAQSCHPRTAKGLGRAFFPVSLATLGMTVVLLLSRDILTFYAAWELTSICAAFLLLTRFDERSGAAATRYLLSSVLLSALAFFAVVWTGLIAGSFDLPALGRMASLAAPEVRWLATGTLVAMALFRSAVLPFHVWMNKALQATRPQAASLLFIVFPATGFFAMIRVVLPHLPLEVEWSTTIAALGLLTALSGSAAALRPKDALGILAYTCVGQVGFVAIGIGIGSGAGLAAASFQLFGIGVSLSLLYLVATSHSALFGRMSPDRWRSSAMTRPLAFIAVGTAFWSTAGLPPLGGFGARMLLVESLLARWSTTSAVLLAGIFVATALGLAGMCRLALDISPASVGEDSQEPASRWDRIPILTLAGVCILFGALSPWLSYDLFARIAADSLNISLAAVRSEVTPWMIPASSVFVFACLSVGVLIHVVRTSSSAIASIPMLAQARIQMRRLSLLTPLASAYWQLADMGIFDIYPAISSIVNGVARAAAFVVYASTGRGTR